MSLGDHVGRYGHEFRDDFLDLPLVAVQDCPFDFVVSLLEDDQLDVIAKGGILFPDHIEEGVDDRVNVDLGPRHDCAVVCGKYLVQEQ